MNRILNGLVLISLFSVSFACGDSSSSNPAVDAAVGTDADAPDIGVELDEGVMPDAAPRMDAEVCDCPGNQVCDGTGGCVEPETCESHEDCLGARVCKEGACSDGCRDNADCAGALVCDADTQACVEVTPCNSDANCFEGRLCLDGACSDPCADDGDCGGTQTCVVETGRCMAADTCAGAEDCPGSQVCVEAECVNRCLESTDCPGSQSCVEGVCTEPSPCLRDVDCRGERVCVNDACTNPCMMDGCDRELVCDVATGRCGEQEACTTDAQCFEGRRCENSTCADPCAENADCPGSQQCDANGQCVESGSCADDSSCSPGRICQNAVCVDNCVTAGCGGELTCNEQTGACTEVDPCRRDEQCIGGRYCLEGACTDGCVESTDCPGALACNQGRCEEAGNCFSDEQCLMGRVCNDDLQCTDACSAELPCVGTQTCGENGQCAESGSCTDNRDCLGTRVCHPDASVCVDSCTPGSCIGNQVCNENGFCSERSGCTNDGSCLGDRVCLLGECRTVRCESAGDCAAGEHCVDWSCVNAVPNRCSCALGAACLEDVCVRAAPCSAVNPCQAGSCQTDGTCSECVANADCPGATQCQEGRCEEADPCIADAACLAGRVCDSENSRCTNDLNCADDGFALHAFPSAAIPLTNQMYTGLRICLDEDDWFRFNAEQMAQIIVRHEASGVPLGLSVFAVLDPAIPLDVSTRASGEAWVSVTQPGEYLIRITRPRGAPGEYSLQIKDTACVLDGYEKPWNNDVASQATPVGTQRVLGAVCPGEADWFVFNEGGSATIETTSAATFRDESDNLITEVSQGTRFKVEATGGYAFDLAPIREPALRCEAQDATPVTLGVAQTLNFEGSDDFADVCLGDGAPESVFAVEIPSEGQIEVLYQGDALMTTYGVYDDCEVEPIFCANGLGENLTRTLDAGRYYVVVQGPSVGSVTINHVEPLGCDDLSVVPVGSPTSVSLGASMEAFQGGCFANGPNAIVQFTLNETSRVNIGLSGTTSMPAQTGLALRTTCDDVASQVQCAAGETELTVDALEAGTYSVLVQGAGPGSLNIVANALTNLSFQDACAGMPAALSVGDEFTLTGSLDGATDEWSANACMGMNGNEQFLNFSLADTATVSASLNVPGTLAILSGNCNQPLACGEVTNPVLGDTPTVSKLLAPGDYTLVVDGAGDFETSIRVQ